VLLQYYTSTTRAGIATLFPAFPTQMSLYDRVNITILRHIHNYFKDWPLDKFNLEDIPETARPLQLVTADICTQHIRKNEPSGNRRLPFCITMANSDDPPAWALDFINNLRSGDISSVTKAKDIASDLWRQHSTDYDSNRAVHVKSTDIGTGHTVKRTRQPEERNMTATQTTSRDDNGIYLNEKLFFYKHLTF
jgi:hypothetical protein